MKWLIFWGSTFKQNVLKFCCLFSLLSHCELNIFVHFFCLTEQITFGSGRLWSSFFLTVIFCQQLSTVTINWLKIYIFLQNNLNPRINNPGQESSAVFKKNCYSMDLTPEKSTKWSLVITLSNYYFPTYKLALEYTVYSLFFLIISCSPLKCALMIQASLVGNLWCHDATSLTVKPKSCVM